MGIAATGGALLGSWSLKAAPEQLIPVVVVSLASYDGMLDDA